MNPEESLEEIMRAGLWLLPPPKSDEEMAAYEAERAKAAAARAAKELEDAWQRLVPPLFHWAHPKDPELGKRTWPRDREKRLVPPAVVAGQIERADRSVLLMGQAGSGKTTLALAALRARFLRRPHDVAFVPARVLGLCRIMHPAGHGEPPEVTRALRVGLLVLDDLGNERQTANNACPEVIFERFDAMRPTWVTTGLERAELEQLYGHGVVRRLYERATVIRCEKPEGVQ